MTQLPGLVPHPPMVSETLVARYGTEILETWVAVHAAQQLGFDLTDVVVRTTDDHPLVVEIQAQDKTFTVARIKKTAPNYATLPARWVEFVETWRTGAYDHALADYWSRCYLRTAMGGLETALIRSGFLIP